MAVFPFGDEGCSLLRAVSRRYIGLGSTMRIRTSVRKYEWGRLVLRMAFKAIFVAPGDVGDFPHAAVPCRACLHLQVRISTLVC